MISHQKTIVVWFSIQWHNMLNERVMKKMRMIKDD